MKSKNLQSVRNWRVLGLLLALVVMVSPECALGQIAKCGESNNEVVGGGWLFPGTDFHAVHFVDTKNGMIVGENSTICRTTNGGSSWSPVPMPTSVPPTLVFYDVQFVSASVGWVAVGGAGTVLKIAANFTTSVAQNIGTTFTLRALHFPTASIGWAVGDADTVRKTTNGGSTWVAQSVSPFQGVSDIHCINSTACIVVGSSSGGSSPIKVTTNGGINWLVADVSPTSLAAVHFAPNPIRGFAVGGGGAMRSSSGLLSWPSDNSGTTASLNAVYCVSPTLCWVVGSRGTIRRGTGWVAQNSRTTATLYDVFFINPSTGWVVGSNGTLRRTTNGGATWNP